MYHSKEKLQYETLVKKMMERLRTGQEAKNTLNAAVFFGEVS